MTKACMGMRGGRGVFLIDSGAVKSVETEQPGKFEVSSAEACMMKLG